MGIVKMFKLLMQWKSFSSQSNKPLLTEGRKSSEVVVDFVKGET